MPDRTSLPVRLHRGIRELGLAGAVVLLVDRLLRALSRGHARFVVYALTAQPIGHLGRTGLASTGITSVREVRSGDAVLEDFPTPAAVIQQRFDAGAVCLVATVKGEFAGTLWIAHGQYNEDEVRCLYRLETPARCVWDFDMYVSPRFRGGRILARLWQAADERLAAAGVGWSFSRISLLNAASLAAHRRMGAKRAGTAAFLVLGPVQIAFFSQAPLLHISLTPAQRPTLRLSPRKLHDI